MWRSGLEASLGHCSSPLGYLERQAFSFEVRSQSCQRLKLKPGLWGELAFLGTAALQGWFFLEGH